jgi:uncharacterized membrane protein YccC
MKQNLFRFPKFAGNRLVHSLKTAIAFLLGMFIVHFFKLPLNGTWVLISLLVVMCAQSRVGAIMQKSYMRFLGTLLGAVLAALTLLIAYPNPVWTTLILCLAIGLFSYIADSPGYLSEAGPLGAVTIVIILIGQNPSYTSLFDRFFEITLGIVIALLVSRFVWPLHSRTQLQSVMLSALADLKNLLKELSELSSKTANHYEAYEDKMISNFASQKKLYTEVVRESFGRATLAKAYKTIVQREREAFRCIHLMQNSLLNFPNSMLDKFNQHPQIQKIYTVNQDLLQSIIEQFNNKDVKYNATLEQPSGWQRAIHQEFDRLLDTTSAKLAIDLFLFASERLTIQLKEIETLIQKIP